MKDVEQVVNFYRKSDLINVYIRNVNMSCTW